MMQRANAILVEEIKRVSRDRSKKVPQYTSALHFAGGLRNTSPCGPLDKWTLFSGPDQEQVLRSRDRAARPESLADGRQSAA